VDFDPIPTLDRKSTTKYACQIKGTCGPSCRIQGPDRRKGGCVIETGTQYYCFQVLTWDQPEPGSETWFLVLKKCAIGGESYERVGAGFSRCDGEGLETGLKFPLFKGSEIKSIRLV
jgi:hypothetical protein